MHIPQHKINFYHTKFTLQKSSPHHDITTSCRHADVTWSIFFPGLKSRGLKKNVGIANDCELSHLLTSLTTTLIAF